MTYAQQKRKRPSRSGSVKAEGGEAVIRAVAEIGVTGVPRLPSLRSSPWIRGAPHSGLATPCRGSVGGIRAAPSVCRCDIATSIARTNNSLRRHALGRSSIVFEIETVAGRTRQEILVHEDSYGYRPGKSALDAVGIARAVATHGFWFSIHTLAVDRGAIIFLPPCI